MVIHLITELGNRFGAGISLSGRTKTFYVMKPFLSAWTILGICVLQNHV